MKRRRCALIALVPVYRGLGYVVFDQDRLLVDFGTSETRRDKHVACIEKVGALLRLHAPRVVVLELTSAPSCRRRARIRALIAELALLAEQKGHGVACYDRIAVSQALAFTDRPTKDVMARAIAKRLPPMAHRLPKPRQVWESEKHSMATFMAAGLALAHFASGDHLGTA